MTKKDFVLLAAALKQARPAAYDANNRRAAGDTWLRTCEGIADACATTNPLFDRPKFLDACGTNT